MKPARLVSLLACGLALAATPTAGAANPDRVSVLLGSRHVNASKDFQEVNPGVFLTWERAVDFSIGLYYNSYENVSPLVSAGYDWELVGGLHAGGFVALALYPGDGDAFSHALGDVVPLAGLQVRFRNVFAQLIPAGGETVDALLTFGLTFDLD